MKIWNGVGLSPLLHPIFAQFQSKLFPEVSDGTFERQAGQRRDGGRIGRVRGGPIGRRMQRKKTAEARTDESQPAKPPIEDMAEGS